MTSSQFSLLRAGALAILLMVSFGASADVGHDSGEDQTVSCRTAVTPQGTGIFVISGKPLRIELMPETANKLSGISSVPLPPNLKDAIQITLPTGESVQAKFE